MEIQRFEVFGAEVRAYLHEDYPTLAAHKIRPAIIICPGGAYRWRSPREKDAPAFEFLSEGYQVFILEYSCEEHAADYLPLCQLAQTVATVRAKHALWHIDPDKIAVLGFSAGGHLAASLGTYWNDPDLKLGKDARPDALVLCYPVVSTREYAHEESARWVSGGNEEMRDRMNLHRHISNDFPPSFIWHGGEDTSVPLENSLMLACELKRCGVPLELHIFGSGRHGISTCTQEVETPDPICRAWVPLCKTWLNRRFEFTP